MQHKLMNWLNNLHLVNLGLQNTVNNADTSALNIIQSATHPSQH